MAGEEYNAPLTKPRRRWIRSIILGVVIFICGALVGGGITVKVIAKGINKFYRSSTESVADNITNRLRKRLDLTDDQTARIRSIILERQVELRRIRKDVRPKIETQFENTRREINEILTPAQVKIFEEHYKRMTRFWLHPIEEPQHHDSGGD
jgi:hypothetical protein